MSEKQHRDKVAAIKKAQGKEEAALSKARAAAAKYRAEAARHADKITSRTGGSHLLRRLLNSFNFKSSSITTLTGLNMPCNNLYRPL